MHKVILILSFLFLIGCGGSTGKSSSDTSSVIDIFENYKGVKTQAEITLENHEKFIDAIYYTQIFPLPEDTSSTNGIVEDNQINQNTGLGYIDKTYVNYSYKNDVIANGNVKTIVSSVDRGTTETVVKYNVTINMIYISNGNEFDLNFVYDGKLIVSDTNEDVNEIKILRYELVDSRTKEMFKLVDKDSTIEIYVASEGYVEFHKNNIGSDKFHGNHNSQLQVTFVNENSISENGKELYIAKEGQGSISMLLNGTKLDNLFYTPYKILKKVVPKLSKNDLLEFSLDSWHTTYRLLENDNNDINVSIEWFIDNVKISTKSEYELRQIEYGEQSELKVRITASNGESIAIREEVIESDSNKHTFFQTRDIVFEYAFVYRSNSLTIDLDLLTHAVFNDIDINNSVFSWKIDNDKSATDSLIITEGTEHKKVPTITFLKYNDYSQYLYLKLFHNNEVKIIKFYVQLQYGDDGYGNRPDILESVTEANLSGTNVNSWQMIYKDLDNNGLEDILYTTSKYGSYYLHVSYQNSKREFSATEPYLIVDRYVNIFSFIKTGDFNGDGITDIFIPALSSDENLSIAKIISLEKDNFSLLKEINVSDINLYTSEEDIIGVDILAISDMNNDGKEDLIVYDKNSTQNIIYTNINNFNEKIIVTEGNKTFESQVYVTDINKDGLKDIVYGINIEKVNDIYDIGVDDMLVVNILYQVSNNHYSHQKKTYRFKHFSYNSSRLYLENIILLDDNILVLDTENTEDDDKKVLYSFNLDQNHLDLLSETPLNRRGYSESFYPAIDMNNDGKKDLVSYSTASDGRGSIDVLFQKENYTFTPNYTYSLGLKEEVNSFAHNGILTDIDGDGKIELTTVSALNKFSFINFK